MFRKIISEKGTIVAAWVSAYSIATKCTTNWCFEKSFVNFCKITLLDERKAQKLFRGKKMEHDTSSVENR